MGKGCVDDLALFGGQPLFQKVRPISNLVRPDINVFLSYLKESYDTSYLQDGVLVRRLERRLEKMHGARCVTFCNGLWGMILCASLLASKGKRQVIMPSFTYRRLGDIAAWLGLVPCYCDVDPYTLVVTPETVGSCIGQDSALILATQAMVHRVDYNGLENLARESCLPLMIDSVEAGYATYKGRKVGSFGDAECFSMHASKLLNAFEAGYIATNRDDLIRGLRRLRSCYDMGLNETHAAMALASLDDLDGQIDRNKLRYRTYQRVLGGVVGLTLLEYVEQETQCFKNIAIRLEDSWPLSRSDTLDLLHAEKMLARPYYYPPLHMKQTSYQTISDDLLVTERVSQNHLLLPCGDFVSLQDIELVGEFLGFLSVYGEEINAYIYR